jgi:vancomycin resistance protein YoaR
MYRQERTPTTRPSSRRPVARPPGANRSSAARPSPSWGCLTLTFVALLAAAIPIFLLVTYESAYAEKVYPGVSVLGMPMAGMSRAEAEISLNQRFSQTYRQSLSLRFGDRVWPVTRDEIGLRFHVARTLAAAMAPGRTGNLLDSLVEQLRLRQQGLVIQPVLDLDEVQRVGYLNRLAKEVDRPPLNASIRIEGTAVSPAPSQKGLRVNIDVTSQRLAQALINADSRPVDLAVDELEPAIGDNDVKEAVTGAQAILSAPITVTFEDRSAAVEAGKVVTRLATRTWVVDQVRLGGMLGFRQKAGTDGHTKLLATVSEELAATFVTDLAREVDQPVRDARLELDAKTGALTPTVQSQEGRAIKVADAVRLIVAAASGGPRRVDLPVQIERPKVAMEDIAKMGLVERVSTGTSIYLPSTGDRAFNVKQAAQRLNGIVIAPNELFSFNAALGEVSAETGYRESYSIIGEYTVRDTGGGVCQVATTLFRAVFLGGYTIEDRSAHAYRIRRYEQENMPLGLDATVYDPSTDFRFRNDGPSYLLIQTAIDEVKGTLAFYLYGTKPDWTVTWSSPVLEKEIAHGPKLPDTLDSTLPVGTRIQVQPAEDGVTATITRQVKRGGQVLRTYVFKWTYRPVQEQWIVGAKKG